MSCYFRHIKDVLGEAGIEVTTANKKQVDQEIHHILGTTYKDCPATWKKFKEEILNNPDKKRDFTSKLRSAHK